MLNGGAPCSRFWFAIDRAAMVDVRDARQLELLIAEKIMRDRAEASRRSVCEERLLTLIRGVVIMVGKSKLRRARRAFSLLLFLFAVPYAEIASAIEAILDL